MTSYILSNKEKKAIIEFDKIAKDSFPVYYVNNLCEAFAPREVYSKRECYSFVRDPECRLSFIFRVLNISSNSLITLNHLVIANSMTKLGAIDSIETRVNHLYLKLNEMKTKDYEKIKEFVTKENDYYLVQLGAVVPFSSTIDKIYQYSVPTSYAGFTKIDDETFDDIMGKHEVIIQDNDYSIIVLKPLFPGINDKSELHKRFFDYPDNNELFIANFLLIKEQIYSYHKFIGIRW